MCASAVGWYLAARAGKVGSGRQQESSVWQWISFAQNEITPVACAIVLPLLGVKGVDKKVCVSVCVCDRTRK